VKTTRRTSEGLRVPRSTKLKHAFLRRPFQTPMGPGCRQVHAEVTTARDEGSPCQMQTGTLGRDLAPWQVPYQGGLRNSPPTGKVKGKCALGPFLSILVIKCQHKWFKC
jgi:hypothetical protein